MGKLKMRRVPARCGGKGYKLVAPADPTNWDVATVRVDCRGCEDCELKPEPEKLHCQECGEEIEDEGECVDGLRCGPCYWKGVEEG